MFKFSKYITEEQELHEDANVLLEKLITFGGKAYPKFGNVVIMAGGAGSGKGFILSNLVGLEGKVLDVDELKKMASKSKTIRKRVKDELGLDIEKIAGDLRNPENVAKLHDIVGQFLKLDKRKEQALFSSILGAHPERKPNLVFDTTLKDLGKLGVLSRQLTDIGYDKKNIHIVWVVNDIEVAKAQNAKRARVVPAEILINTHRGAANTMGDIISMGNELKKYMDGDLVFAFNKVGVDATLVKSKTGGQFLKDAEYFYVKRQGKPATSLDKLDRDIKAKIAKYVPKGVDWNS